MSAIRFLTTVAKSVHHKLFADAGTLQQICESIIIPNLRVREDDQEVGFGQSACLCLYVCVHGVCTCPIFGASACFVWHASVSRRWS